MEHLIQGPPLQTVVFIYSSPKLNGTYISGNGKAKRSQKNHKNSVSHQPSMDALFFGNANTNVSHNKCRD